MEVRDFNKQMFEKGWFIFPEFISETLIERMRADLEDSYKRCRQIQIENGLDKTEGTCHHILDNESSFIECLAEYEKLDPYFTEYFQGKYILNSFGGNLLFKGMSYANEIHRDIRSYSGALPLMLNTLVMLDNFTVKNGATWLMYRGHLHPDKPIEEVFMKQSFQITGKAGSVAIWNSNLWHRSGENNTAYPRRSVTPELTKPFMKQGFDYTQFVNDDTPEYLKQVLGYYSRTPQSLNDWYQQPNERLYRSDQG